MARIRVATPADFPEMHRVRTSVLENRLSDPARVQSHHYEALLDAGGRAWVAEAGDRIVGFAAADLARANVWALFVEPGHEGRGIGRRLHDTMMEWIFAAGVERVWLGTDPGTRAEAFYRAAGWRHRGMEANGEARYEMSREEWSAPDAGTLETERLTLRPMEREDADFMLRLLNEPAFLRHIGDRGVRTRADAEGYIDRGPRESYRRHGFGPYLVELREGRTPLGMCGLMRKPWLELPDLAYAFAAEAGGKGYALEAAGAVMRAAWDEGHERVLAVVTPDNARSIRLLEKLGFRKEGRVADPADGAELLRYGIDREGG